MKISPHVQIYKFPITAISSITNRLTGLSLSGFFLVGGLSCLTNKNKFLLEKYKELDKFKMKLVVFWINLIFLKISK